MADMPKPSDWSVPPDMLTGAYARLMDLLNARAKNERVVEVALSMMTDLSKHAYFRGLMDERQWRTERTKQHV